MANIRFQYKEDSHIENNKHVIKVTNRYRRSRVGNGPWSEWKMLSQGVQWLTDPHGNPIDENAVCGRG